MILITRSLCIHPLTKINQNETYYVCHENKDPKEAAKYLMTRRLKDEF